MKRKLFCLLLALAMCLSCFATVGCSNNTEEGGDEDTSRKPITLTLWLPTDENTTEEAILSVQEAISKITQAKYDTAIEFRAIPSDEYEAAVDARLTEIETAIEEVEAEEKRKKEEAKANAAAGITTSEHETTSDAETTAEWNETYVDEYGQTHYNYLPVDENQMDIFLVRGWDNYSAYIEREALSALDTELGSTGKILKQYIYPSFLNYMKVLSSTYAIPNNHQIGEYKFLLVNKRLVDELYWDAESLTKLIDCEDFIMDVKNFTDVTPFLAPVEPSEMHYWSADGEWSILATQINENYEYESYAGPMNIFSITNATNTIYLMKLLEEQNCFAADPETCEEFGVGVVSGDASVRASYEEDYYVYIYEYPRATTENLYEAMFAVSSYTKSVSRSMEIITLINTDPEIRTILQYGVEGEHWEYTDDSQETITIISDDYKMNLIETGNVYMTYPGEGIPMSAWEYAKQQNLDSLVSPYLRIDFSAMVTEDNQAVFDELATISKEYKERIDAMSAAEFKENLNALKTEVTFLPVVLDQLSSTKDGSLLKLYQDLQRAR